jgi:hypothetical protein
MRFQSPQVEMERAPAEGPAGAGQLPFYYLPLEGVSPKAAGTLKLRWTASWRYLDERPDFYCDRDI